MTDHPESICTQLDLFNEIFEIIDSCTFSAKSISPTMWQAFELMHKTFKNGAELYLEGGTCLQPQFVPFPPVGGFFSSPFARLTLPFSDVD